MLDDGSGRRTYLSERNCGPQTLSDALLEAGHHSLTRKNALAPKVYTKTPIEGSVPSFKKPARMVTMILWRHQSLLNDGMIDTPNEFIAPVSDQFDAARAAASHVQQVAAEFDCAELHDDHFFFYGAATTEKVCWPWYSDASAERSV